jgi:hypothetical protein
MACDFCSADGLGVMKTRQSPRFRLGVRIILEMQLCSDQFFGSMAAGWAIKIILASSFTRPRDKFRKHWTP